MKKKKKHVHFFFRFPYYYIIHLDFIKQIKKKKSKIPVMYTLTMFTTINYEL